MSKKKSNKNHSKDKMHPLIIVLLVAMLVSAAIAFSISGTKPELSETTGRVETTEIVGDPSVGSILYIKQIHPLAEDVINASQPGFNGELKANIKTVLTIGEYQYCILLELNRIKPKHLFVEGHYTLSRGVEKEKEKRFAEVVYKFFPNGWEKKKPTPEQKRFLYLLQAYRIYLVLSPETKIHKTESLEQVTACMEEFRKTELEVNNIRELRTVCEREKYVVNRIKSFLKEFPKEQVVLIFGAEHVFHDYFLDIKPVFKTIKFTKLMEELMRECE